MSNAVDILDGRFNVGESLIATDAKYSYEYAKQILNGRFLEGEEVMATDTKYAKLYRKLTGVKL